MTEEQLRSEMAELCLEAINTTGAEATYGVVCVIQRHVGRILEEEFDKLRKDYLAEGK